MESERMPNMKLRARFTTSDRKHSSQILGSFIFLSQDGMHLMLADNTHSKLISFVRLTLFFYCISCFKKIN